MREVHIYNIIRRKLQQDGAAPSRIVCIEGITTMLDGLPGIVMPFLNKTLGQDLRDQERLDIKDRWLLQDRLSILRDVTDGLYKVFFSFAVCALLNHCV